MNEEVNHMTYATIISTENLFSPVVTDIVLGCREEPTTAICYGSIDTDRAHKIAVIFNRHNSSYLFRYHYIERNTETGKMVCSVSSNPNRIVVPEDYEVEIFSGLFLRLAPFIPNFIDDIMETSIEGQHILAFDGSDEIVFHGISSTDVVEKGEQRVYFSITVAGEQEGIILPEILLSMLVLTNQELTDSDKEVLTTAVDIVTRGKVKMEEVTALGAIDIVLGVVFPDS